MRAYVAKRSHQSSQAELKSVIYRSTYLPINFRLTFKMDLRHLSIIYYPVLILTWLL